MADSATLNKINSSRVLQAIWSDDGISRIQLAKQLGLNRSTLTKISTKLLDMGLITQTELGPTSKKSGRPRISLAINKNMGYIGGIQIQPEFCRSLLIDLDTNIIYKNITTFDPKETDLVEFILSLINELTVKAEELGSKVLGIGLGCSGNIDPYKGIIIRSHPLMISEDEPLHLQKILSEKVSIPIIIDNDANCCSWGELATKRKDRDRNFISVFGEFRNTKLDRTPATSVGVGLGVVIREKILYGEDFAGGEFQSIFRVDENATQFSLTDEEASSLPENDVVRNKMFVELAKNLSLIVNSINLTNLIISGSLSNYFDEIKGILNQQIQENWLYYHIRECKIELSQHGEWASAFGAAAYFLVKLFSVPTLDQSEDNKVGLELLNEVK